MGLEWENPENERFAQRVSGYRASDMEPEQFMHYVSALLSLWEDDAIQSTFSRRREFQIVRLLFLFVYCLFVCLFITVFVCRETRFSTFVTDSQKWEQL